MVIKHCICEAHERAHNAAETSLIILLEKDLTSASGCDTAVVYTIPLYIYSVLITVVCFYCHDSSSLYIKPPPPSHAQGSIFFSCFPFI